MEYRTVQINCAGNIANLEGRRGVFFTREVIGNNTLPELNKRLRALETHNNVTPPPPNQEPTWESLAWRICSLGRKPSVYGTPRTRQPSGALAFAAMIPDLSNVSNETLQILCTDLLKKTSYGFPSVSGEHIIWPKCVDDEEMLNAITQGLCFAAGKHNVLVSHIPKGRAEIYSELVELTLELKEAPSPLRVALNDRVPTPPSWTRPTLPPCPHKMTCKCTCHGFAAEGDKEDGRPQLRWVGFDWLKKLACWRRSEVDHDSSSTTGSTRSTLSSTITGRC